MDKAMRLLSMLDMAEEDRGTTPEDEYGFDPTIALGKWINFFKLGRRTVKEGDDEFEEFVQVRLAMFGDENEKFKNAMTAAREKYGDEQGKIPEKTMEEILPPIFCNSVWIGMRTVRRKVGAADYTVVYDAVRMVAGSDPWPDSLPNRLRVLLRYGSKLQGDLFKIARNNKNFRDLGEDALGN